MESLSERLFEQLQKIPRSYYLPIVLGMIGFVFLIIGMIQLFSAKQDTQVAVQNSSQTSPTTLTPQTRSASSGQAAFGMQVDVEGAVVRPGVYKLSQNARVQDALIAAGGLSASADREVIAKSLNLAAKVTDGAKIYISKLGDPSVIGSSTFESNPSVNSGQAGLININTSSASQLDSLPGIGSVTSAKIIAARPYATVDDLLTKKVVSSTVFVKIKDKISVY